MNETPLWPGLLTLAVGILGGLLLALRLKRQSKRADKTEDLELKIADLEERRDELYERLGGTTDEELEEADRIALERAAAHTLRELERCRAAFEDLHPKGSQKPAKGKGQRTLETQKKPEPQRGGYRHPLLVGFLFGAGMVGLVATLIFWALQDAPPVPQQAQQQAAPGQGSGPSSALPPGIAAKVEELQARLEADPNDTAVMKELAQVLLAANRLVEAFQLTEPILNSRPADPDGLYIQAFVRVAMGQAEMALGLLDRAMDSNPGYVDAYVLRGLILLRRDEREGAIKAWEGGLLAAGGSHPGLEHLLSRARQQGLSAEEVLSLEAATVTDREAAPQSSTRFEIRVELPPGTESVPAGTLFVSLRGEYGPPAAVKRLDRPTFPLDLVLSQSDSMMGAPLPESGTLVARLDSDGNASTQNETDLVAQAAAQSGTVTTLILGR